MADGGPFRLTRTLRVPAETYRQLQQFASEREDVEDAADAATVLINEGMESLREGADALAAPSPLYAPDPLYILSDLSDGAIQDPVREELQERPSPRPGDGSEVQEGGEDADADDGGRRERGGGRR